MWNFLWNNITGLFEGREFLIGGLGGLSLLMFVGSLIAVPLVIVRLPEDYIRREHKLVRKWPRHIWVPFLILKNGLGVLFLLSGLSMLILPGQGLLTLFIGLVLLDFPRKRILIHRILGCRPIYGAINSLRARFGKPKLEPPLSETVERLQNLDKQDFG
ncbi:MAG TPA: hypothetical protein ENN94_04875 [Geoalkalibacter subterraneus]|uniref:Transmembrane protein (PGPGW) n=1 Tax=Geoalkalibacter subterraneus TaxID=483547 RepID=A0A831PNQ3_9BACT|nr:hypothetical protein [Geoalkalibacter subterraneus]